MAREWQLRFSSEESRGPRVCAAGGWGELDAMPELGAGGAACVERRKSKVAELFQRGEENGTLFSRSTAGAEMRIRKNFLVALVEGRLGRVSQAKEILSGLRSG